MSEEERGQERKKGKREEEPKEMRLEEREKERKRGQKGEKAKDNREEERGEKKRKSRGYTTIKHKIDEKKK